MSEKQPNKRQLDISQIVALLVAIIVGIFGVIEVVIPRLWPDPTPVSDVVQLATLNVQSTYDAIGTARSETATATLFTATSTPTETYAPTSTPTTDPTETAVLPSTTLTLAPTSIPPSTTFTATPSTTPTLTATQLPPTSTLAPTANLNATLAIVAAQQTQIALQTVEAELSSQATSAATIVQTGYPCPGVIVSTSGGTILNIVHSEPYAQAARISSIRVGTNVIVVDDEQQRSGDIWYRIENTNGQSIGWVLSNNLSRSDSCPE